MVARNQLPSRTSKGGKVSEQLTMNVHLVAFVDILGFRKKLERIETQEDLKKIHADILGLHDTFSKTPQDDFEKHEREISRRKVIALSDALVIAADLKSPISNIMGIFDNLCYELDTIGLNQAYRAINGTFLRGGVSLGQFYFHDDVLISKAMKDAYTVESSQTVYPVIALDEKTFDFFSNNSGNNCYAEEIKPKNTLFRKFTGKEGRVLHHIDYIRIGLEAAFSEFTRSDRNRWKNVDATVKDSVRAEISKSHAVQFLMWHKGAVEKALVESQDDSCVHDKYLWLKDYHNEIALETFPQNHECKI